MQRQLWTFLYKMLGNFDHEEKFIRVIQALYDRPSAHIKITETWTIILNCVEWRLGCAIAPLLFDLFIEAPGQSIRQNENIKSITTSRVEHKVANVCR